MVKLRKRQTVVRMKRTSKEEFPHKNFSFSVALDVVAVYVFSHCEILFGNFHNFSLLYRRFLTEKKNFSFSSRFSLSSWTRGSDIFFLLLCFLLSLRKSHSQILVRSSLLLWRYIMLNAQGAKFDISKKARFFSHIHKIFLLFPMSSRMKYGCYSAKTLKIGIIFSQIFPDLIIAFTEPVKIERAHSITKWELNLRFSL